jgi:modulator of FtsH protease
MSAATASLAMFIDAAPLSPWLTLLGYFGLLFTTNFTRNSGWGLVSVFALTGFMGYTLGPILNLYIHHLANGHEIVMMSLGGTGLVFFGLSAYALTTRKDFSFMGGFLAIGILVAFLLSIAGLIFHVPGLTLAVSAMFIFLSSGVILFQTSQIIHGGETNYIMATITLYVSLYNIFISMLTLLSGGNRN